MIPKYWRHLASFRSFFSTYLWEMSSLTFIFQRNYVIVLWAHFLLRTAHFFLCFFLPFLSFTFVSSSLHIFFSFSCICLKFICENFYLYLIYVYCYFFLPVVPFGLPLPFLFCLLSSNDFFFLMVYICKMNRNSIFSYY